MIEGYRDFFTYRKKFERKKMMDEKMMFIMMIFLAATFMLLIYTIFKNIKQSPIYISKRRGSNYA